MSVLPDLNDFVTVEPSKIEEFREKGHVLLHEVLKPAEVAPYREVIRQSVLVYNTEHRALADRDTYGKAFLQIMNLWWSDPGVRSFVLAKRFGKIAADLLGVENVRIYHDQALFKEPGGGPTPWHQDQFYWPVDTSNTITMWMPLVDIGEEMGMLTFASGSHQLGSVFDYEISDRSQHVFQDFIQQHGFVIHRASSMKAGDATFHYGYTIHNAPGNQSSDMREVMTVIYVADGARVIDPQNKGQVNDHKTWLREVPVGHLINSDLNPLVF